MRKNLAASIRIVAEIAFLAVLVYFSLEPLGRLADEFRDTYFPCSRKLTYRVDIFDQHFGLKREDFLAAAVEAELIWERPARRQLFAWAEDGQLRLNLIYDYRQEATDKLREMGLVINDDKATYDSLKPEYDQADAAYRRKKAEYEAALGVFDARQAEYEKEVVSWNRRGGAPSAEFERLASERSALEAEVGRLKTMAAGVNEQAGKVNALVTVLNKLIKDLNLSADTFNSVAQDRGREFQQGMFRDSTAGNEIDIYEFDDRQQLLRVLVHEFGHALGLEHVEDPAAIMNARNAGSVAELSATDISALKARCRIK